MLLNLEVGRASSEVQSGCRGDRTTDIMGCYRHIAHIPHRCDLLGLQETTRLRNIRL